jgi:hypothetical protein
MITGKVKKTLALIGGSILKKEAKADNEKQSRKRPG